MRGLLPARTIYYYPIYQYNWTMRIVLLISLLLIEIITLIVWATFSTNIYIYMCVIEPLNEGHYEGIEALLWFISTGSIYLITNLSLIISIIATINLLRKKSLSLLEKFSLFIASFPILLFIKLIVYVIRYQ